VPYEKTNILLLFIFIQPFILLFDILR